MAQASRIEIALKLRDQGILPIFYNADPDVCINVVKSCYEGGIRVIEITNRGDFAHETFREVNQYIVQHLPGMILGAGTIVDSGTASLYIQLGANFIVSPYLKEDMGITCNRRKILWIPGCGSLNEIARAEEMGAEICKIFPVNSMGGPDFIKDIKAPCPWTKILATGGIKLSEQSISQWLKAGAWCLGMGSQLMPKEAIQNNQYDIIQNNCETALAIVNKIRNA
jgi:2-dehydro-3-deoxyphosphogluconate aldolase/(4S)-4-hydroxy-2-oxoglutarate aldolase